MKKAAGPGRRGIPIRDLVQAILAEGPSRVRELLAANRDMMREPGSWEALIVAARKGMCDVATLLLDQGADPNAPGDYGPDRAHTNLERPLHWAAGHGQQAM